MIGAVKKAISNWTTYNSLPRFKLEDGSGAMEIR
jgi:hypothetical protein